jgi:hypothetical protein
MSARFPLLLPPRPTPSGSFNLRGRSARVRRDWDTLAERVPNDTQRCYVRLTTDPYQRIPGRVFPLRGRVFGGLWEFEINRSDRLYYLPDAQAEPEMEGWSPDVQGANHEGDSDRVQPDLVARICLVFACGGHIPPPHR